MTNRKIAVVLGVIWLAVAVQVGVLAFAPMPWLLRAVLWVSTACGVAASGLATWLAS